MSDRHLDQAHLDLLVQLLGFDTVSPMETGRCSEIEAAQQRLEEFAVERGFTTVHYGSPAPDCLADPRVPLTVRERDAEMGPAFLSCQPNLVLQRGRASGIERTLMLNFHIDTVAGDLGGRFDGRIFFGRGAADAKGPGVALLAGVAAAFRQDPTLEDRIRVLIQSVAGEEGGAMGCYGTKRLAEQGHVGRLNLFAEPSGGGYFDHSTTSMTARIDMQGEGSTDDAPCNGQNASILLGFVAQRLARQLAGEIERRGGKLCIAGLHTGQMHNRVYGAGRLLLNLAYRDLESGEGFTSLTEAAVREALRDFSVEFSGCGVAQRAAVRAEQVVRLEWLKRGLPVLANRDAAMETVLETAGLRRASGAPFTCDAMWGQRRGSYAVVCGPGDLAANRAHAEGEFMELGALESYAAQIARIVHAFGGVQNPARITKSEDYQK